MNHSMKSLRKSFSTIKNELYFAKRGEQPIYSAIEKVLSYAIFLSSNTHDSDQRVHLWLNCP